jgi:hypothetical protein
MKFCPWLRNLGLSTLLATVIAPVSAADSKSADKWQFEADLYLWGASLDVTPTKGDTIHFSFSDIVDNLKMAFMGGLGARKGKWSLLSDVIYLKVKDDQKGSVHLPRHNIATKADVEIEAWAITLAGGYEVMKTDRFNIDLLVGARYLSIDIPVELDVGPIKKKASPSGNGWDGIVGARGKVAISDKWYMSYYGDVGTGDSDLTWQALLGLNYRFDAIDVGVGYRYLDFDIGGTAVDDMTIKGPYAGLKVLF